MVRHRGDRETSSAVQRADFDGSALINFFVGSASRRWVVSTVCVGTALVGRIDGLCRHCVGRSYRRSASALRRRASS